MTTVTTIGSAPGAGGPVGMVPGPVGRVPDAFDTITTGVPVPSLGRLPDGMTVGEWYTVLGEFGVELLANLVGVFGFGLASVCCGRSGNSTLPASQVCSSTWNALNSAATWATVLLLSWAITSKLVTGVSVSPAPLLVTVPIRMPLVL